MLKKQYVKSRDIVKVTFELSKTDLPEDIQAESIQLVGEFNDWDTVATPMPLKRGDVFRTMVELEPGRAYHFRYLINGEYWCNDSHADTYAAGGAGADNGVVMTQV